MGFSSFTPLQADQEEFRPPLILSYLKFTGFIFYLKRKFVTIGKHELQMIGLLETRPIIAIDKGDPFIHF